VNGQTGVVVLDAADVGADAAGTAAAAVATHVAATNPHPEYLTQAEGDTAYAPIAHVGAGGAAHANAVAAGAAGFMTGADKTKLDGIATGATQNSSDAFLRARGNHTGTQTASTISDFAATVRATVLTGLSLASGAAVTAADSALAALGKLQKQITDLVAAVAGKQDTLVSGTTLKTVNGSSLLGSGDLVVTGGTSLPVVQTFTGAKTLALTDINTYNVSQGASAQAVTLPAQATVAWTSDAEIHFQQGAAGAVNITAAAGVSINGVTAGTFTLAGIYSAATLKRTASNAWTLIGAPATTGASGDWCNATGTANAIVLTPASATVRASYATGDQFRARIGTTNTGATTVNVAGLGVKTCVTVTGAALPAGYIRTDAATVMTYDGTNFVVDRLAEYGSNANGEFWRYADGRLDCEHVVNAGTAWTFPASFAGAAGGIRAFVTPRSGLFRTSGAGSISTTGFTPGVYDLTALAQTTSCSVKASGAWY
jgi:hypothetical protein